MARHRISIAAVMMFTLTAASAFALFIRVVQHLVPAKGFVDFPYDQAALFVLGVVTIGVGLAAWRKHTSFHAMLQITLACLGLISLIGTAELTAAWKTERPLLYWYQIAFALLVVAPLIARRIVRTRTERGPVRNWRMRTCEAVTFAFLNMILIFAGLFFQFITAEVFNNVMTF